MVEKKNKTGKQTETGILAYTVVAKSCLTVDGCNLISKQYEKGNLNERKSDVRKNPKKLGPLLNTTIGIIVVFDWNDILLLINMKTCKL